MIDKGSTELSAYTYYRPPKTFVKLAIRVIKVLEYFYRDRQPTRAAEISRELELPISSTKYLLASLVESGYLTFDRVSKTYFPSILFSGFASWLAEVYPNGEVLRALAREAHQRLNNVVAITVLHEQNMRAFIIETDSDKTPPAYDFRVRIPLIGSASGSAVLAAKPEDAVSEIVARELRKLPPNQRKLESDGILSRIRHIRRRGYAVKTHTVSVDGNSEHYLAVAIALPADGHSPPMSLTICGNSDDLTGREATLADTMKSVVEKYRDELQYK